MGAFPRSVFIVEYDHVLKGYPDSSQTLTYTSMFRTQARELGHLPGYDIYKHVSYPGAGTRVLTQT